jgi:hypothetical protein
MNFILKKLNLESKILRLYRLVKTSNGSSACEVVSVKVPRRSDLFQSDIFTNTFSGQASIESGQKWFLNDVDPKPQKMNLIDLYELCKKKSVSLLVKSSPSRALVDFKKTNDNSNSNSNEMRQSFSCGRLSLRSIDENNNGYNYDYEDEEAHFLKIQSKLIKKTTIDDKPASIKVCDNDFLLIQNSI